MGLISSLNNAMASLAGKPRPTDIQARPLGKAEPQIVSKAPASGSKPAVEAALAARQVRIDQTLTTSLLDYQLRQISEASSAEAQVHGFSRLQALFAPGSAKGADTGYEALYAAMTDLAAAPNDADVQSRVVAAARGMASSLNRLAANLSDIGAQAGMQMGTAAARANSLLTQLSAVNLRLGDGNMRQDLLAQRDTLVTGLAAEVDIKARYGEHGQVSLTTRGGVSLLGGKPSRFEMDGGALLLRAGDTTLNFSENDGASGGVIGGLIGLQNKTLVVARTQIDAIAAGLDQLFFAARETVDGEVDGGRLFTGGDASSIAVDPAFAADPTLLVQFPAGVMDSEVEIAGASAGLGAIVGQVVSVQSQVAARGIAAAGERAAMLEAVGSRLSAQVTGVRDEIARLASLEVMLMMSSNVAATFRDTLEAL